MRNKLIVLFLLVSLVVPGVGSLAYAQEVTTGMTQPPPSQPPPMVAPPPLGQGQMPYGGQFGPQSPGNFGPGGFGPGNFGPGGFGPSGPGGYGPNQGGGSYGQFGPGGQGGLPGGGDFEAVERRMREEGNKMRLRGMQQGVKTMEREVARIEKRFATLGAKGVPISNEAKTALQSLKDFIAKIKSAQSGEELEDVQMEDMGDYMEEINEGLQRAEMSAQFPKVIREATRELARRQSALKRAEARAKRVKIDTTTLLAEWRMALTTLEGAKAKAEQLWSSGEVEEASEAMQESFFAELDTVGEKERVFMMVSDTQQIVRMATAEIKAAERRVALLKKKQENTTELEAIIARAKAKLDEIKQAMTTSPLNAEVLINLVEELAGIKSDFDEAAGSVSGAAGPNIPGLEGFKPFQLPSGFQQFFPVPNAPPSTSIEGSGGPGFLPPLPTIPFPQSIAPQQTRPPLEGNIARSVQLLLENIRAKLEVLRDQ